MVLKEYSGNAPTTRLGGNLAQGATTSFAVITGGGTGYPTGATAPFVVVIDPDTAFEEKILVATRSGDTFNTLTRGYDGTTDQAHSGQAEVKHVWDAISATEAIAHANNTTGNVHPQYVLDTDLTASYTTTSGMNTAIAAAITASEGDTATDIAAAITHHVVHTFAVAGDIAVPSGDVDYVVPFFVSVKSGRTLKLVAARHRINSGTSATVKLQKNGVDITGFTALSVTTTSTTTDPADVTLADGDLIALIVTAVSGNPKNMTFTLYLEHS